MSARYVVGIDLGTTHSALAYAPIGEENARVEVLSVPQLVAQGTVEEFMKSDAVTAQYLSGRRSIEIPTERRKPRTPCPV